MWAGIRKDTLSELEKINTKKDFKLLQALFNNIDELEATEYYYIIKGRIEVLKKFEEIIPKSKERVIQEHIFNHLWLLDTTWERASENPHMEESVLKEFRADKVPLTSAEKKGRLDIRYKSTAGKHLIIELKKYKTKIEIHSLCKQVAKYKSALLKCLRKKFPNQHHEIEIICILGEPPSPSDDQETNRKLLKAHNARFITYDELVTQTKTSYSDYIETQKKITKLLNLLEKI
ncbi:MAG: hypothetical protein K8S27_11230 [Candidatus Omnitrophica bacterium]|nr:hypothetical protein [Candidatus Omnitrophota bacterium]